MIRLVTLAALVACAFGAALPNGLVIKHFQERIVGGIPIEISDAPHQIGLLYYNTHRCGASLITPDVVVTAAHCVDGLDVKLLSIRAGTDGRDDGVKRNVGSYVIHPSYGNLDYDVAVIHLENALTIGPKIQTIDLAEDDEIISGGENAFVTGWGALSEGGSSPTQLHGVHVPMVERKQCDTLYGGGITDRMVCAGREEGGRDSCQGDSGGPLTIDGHLSGIVSWGYGCARPKYPGVYASVAALRKWINGQY